jgi:alpha-L-rhamnosidase
MPGAPLKLRCEFVDNPQGVTRSKPRLSWWVNDPRPAELQTAYKIEAATSEALLLQGVADVWSSGVIESDQNLHVVYGGSALVSGQRVWWRVCTYDSDGLPSPWSEPAHFQMGLLHATDWTGQWIAGHLRASPARGVQAVALRQEFVVEKPITNATIYVCALGDYRLEINGRRLPLADCNAVWSDFGQRAYYQVFDVTDLLLREPNCIGVLLSDGYFAGELAGQGRAIYGDRPQLKLQLDIELADGSRRQLCSDKSWRWCPSWVLAAEINGGEHVDARQYVQGWSEPGLDDCRWMPVDVLPNPDITLCAQTFSGLTIKQVLRPVNLPRTSRVGDRLVSVYDFGDDLLGRAQVDIVSKDHDNILLTYSLDERFERATSDSYMSGASPTGEIFTGQFALHGFRYLRIEYTGRTTKVGNVSALRIAPWETQGLSFRSDHSSLNELFDILHNSVQAVALSSPLLGLEPEQRRIDTAYAGAWLPAYAQQPQARALVDKWIEDVLLIRVQALGEGNTDFQAFDTLVNTIWTLYRYQNDVALLKRCYPILRVAALSYRHLFGKLLREGELSDAYGQPGERMLVATASAYGSVRTLEQIAGVLNHLGDLELLKSLATDIRVAFRARFLTGDGHLVAESQSVYVAVLAYELLDAPERVRAEHFLIELVQSANYHVDVAPVLMPLYLPTLTRAGRLDLAYMCLLQTSDPSWLASINQGSRLLGRETSECSVADIGIWHWLVESLIGLAVHETASPEHNGYRMARVRPMPPLGKHFLAGSPVEFVEASLQTIHGSFEIKWWIREDCFELELLVPPGCGALVTMPDDIEQTVQSGFHRFVMGFEIGGDGVPILLELAGADSSGLDVQLPGDGEAFAS